MLTPWGESQTIEQIAPGIRSVTTSSHGGINLSNDRVKELQSKYPGYKTFRNFENWFEEDCDWSIVATAWPEFFSKEHVEIATKIVKRSHPEIVL
jgi:hypothetical protein